MNPFEFFRTRTDKALSVRPRKASTQLSLNALEDRFVPTTGLFSWGQSIDWGKIFDHVWHDRDSDKGDDHKSDRSCTCDDSDVDLFGRHGSKPQGSDQLLPDGIYKLSNHPEFGIGLRLDNLITDTQHPATTYNFDFDHPQSNVKMEVKGDTIRIYGRMFGGREADWQTKEFDHSTTGLWEIEFEYTNVKSALNGEDDDKEVPVGGDPGSGTLIQLYGEHLDFELQGKFGETFAFRLGDNDDDQGYAGFPGVSGWGWLMHSGNDFQSATSDWNFIAKLEKKPDDCKRHDDDHDDKKWCDDDKKKRHDDDDKKWCDDDRDKKRHHDDDDRDKKRHHDDDDKRKRGDHDDDHKGKKNRR